MAEWTTPRIRDGIVLLIGMSPCLIIYHYLWYMKNAVLAMFVMHTVGMLALPLLYLTLISTKKKIYLDYWKLECERWRERILLGIAMLVLTAVFGFLFAIGAACTKDKTNLIFGNTLCVPVQVVQVEAHGLKITTKNIALISLYFSIINPIIEELFWRVFLLTEWGIPLPLRTRDALPEKKKKDLEDEKNELCIPIEDRIESVETNDSNDREEREEREAGERDSLVQEDVNVVSLEKEKSLKTRVIVIVGGICYASYHVIVISSFINFPIGLFSFFFLAALGIAWYHLLHHPAVGFVPVLFMHAGIDIAVILFLTNLRFDWF